MTITISNNLDSTFIRFLILIKSGELIGFAYTLPRNLKDKPIKIPPDIFLSGEIFWDKSELKFKNMEFTGIRIIKSPELLKNEPEKEIKEVKTIKIAKPSFADLDPELHIDEKKAAEYLGISFRTLQGYRGKGYGPKYRKFKKAVRYKVADLRDWVEKSTKENTAQY